jgi:hypothetical protein
MVPFRVFATPQPRSASSPPLLCGLRELCVKIPTPFHLHFHISRATSAKSVQKISFQINALPTLPSSVSSKSLVCHSYENCRVCTNNSHSGTHLPPRIHLSSQSLTQCPFCKSFLLIYIHLMGGVWGYSRHSGSVSHYLSPIPFLFTFLRTLLHPEKSYPYSYQELPHSLRKTTGGRGAC